MQWSQSLHIMIKQCVSEYRFYDIWGVSISGWCWLHQPNTKGKYRHVPNMNSQILDTIFKTMDDMADADLLCPQEFLHKVDPRNFRHHKISLKVAASIMLLQNINQSIVLCNGTSPMVTRLGIWVNGFWRLRSLLVATLATAYISMIVLHVPSIKWPFTLQW
jgi:hypothetical protein